jgi:phosphoribosyl 1,2-cyclic phosphate phosphodiesterase
MKITMLGCGGSLGVPTITNDWGECDPSEPRNRRTRPSIVIETGGKVILVDAGPDLRLQMLAAKITHVDAILFTHEHADHIMGVDDLRPFSLATGKPLEIYGMARTIETLQVRFDYMFQASSSEYTRAFVNPHIIEAGDYIAELGIQTFAQEHATRVPVSLGLRSGAFGYSTDVIRIGEEGFRILDGVDTWIVAALRRQPHNAHASLETVLQWIDRVKPRHAILTHMNYMMDYQTLRAELPPHVEPGYDNMVIALED